MKKFDFLILGSGIAGLSFALKVSAQGRVAIITKKNRAESNTNYAQGGIAAVTGRDDSFELHVLDTVRAGAGLCKENVVHTIVSEGPALVRELIELGVRFTENAHGGDDLGSEGGQTLCCVAKIDYRCVLSTLMSLHQTMRNASSSANRPSYSTLQINTLSTPLALP